ncbi:MAG: alpha/beta fold hydrolase [Rhodocyclaceae bacterium]|nr:alpha/beta fold hydrolase [Rhodocyclaceae bacterium]
MTDTLIVMAPGALMSPQDFAAAGFDTDLALHWPQAALIPASIDVNQLDVDACVATLHDQVLAIAAAHPGHRLVLGGISLGAAVSLQYARRYPAQVHGLCLLAPYPGSRITTQAIRAAGGPGRWRLSEAQAHDAEFLLWQWMIAGHGELPLYLGYGENDRFADGQGLMVEAMPGAIRHVIAGDHDWPTWQCLWQDFVARRPFVAPATTLRKAH